jgi:hypothetical protein
MLHDTLFPLLSENLYVLDQEDIRSQIWVTSQDEIVDAAFRQQNLARNEIHILDDYWLQLLIDQQQEATSYVLNI